MRKPTPTIPEGLYPMRAVTRFTGLSPDVIRVWQRRYGAVQPGRTEGRARRYSAAEIRRLVLLQELTRRGHSIGDVARLPDDRLEALLDRGALLEDPAAPPAADGGHSLAALAEAYLADIARFETRKAYDTLARAAALLPPTVFALGVVVPILREVGDRWERRELTIAHEHVVSAHMKGFLTGLLRLVPPPPPGAPRLLAATPRDQDHEFGALMAAWLAAVEGWDTTYAGPDLPAEDLMAAADGCRADVVVLSILRVPPPAELDVLAAEMKALARRVRLWIGLPEGHPLRARLRNVRMFHRLEDLMEALDGLRRLRAAPGDQGQAGE